VEQLLCDIYELLTKLGETESEAKLRLEELKQWTEDELNSYKTDLGMLIGWE